jgi:multiple sugar transport system substrate-binding protein
MADSSGWQHGRRQLLGAALLAPAALAAPVVQAAAPTATTVLTVAAFPSVDEIIRAAIPAWQQRHPQVGIKVVSRQFADHHTAMTTALSTSVYLPDVMALEVGYVGRFAQGGGLEDLRQPPFNIEADRALYVPFA